MFKERLLRTERDSVGARSLDAEALYGVQSLRAKENFPISGLLVQGALIEALAYIKKACALANMDAQVLEVRKGHAIVEACDEMLAGKLNAAFIVDPIQGGAGTSLNMNANEVIANRAIQLLGGQPGEYALVHPNDDVNAGQSTNDVIPTAGKLALLGLLDEVTTRLDALIAALEDKGRAFADILKLGRTQLQDAVPMRLGDAFFAFAHALSRERKRIQAAEKALLSVNLGGTAIGTGINAHPIYFERVLPYLQQETGRPLLRSGDLIDGTQNTDAFVEASAALKSLAVTLSKLCNDLRLLSSGPRGGLGELTLPAMQNGSSIMPGKVNPVIPEVVNQIAFRVMGNDLTVTLAAQSGQLELNAFEPILLHSLFESAQWLANGMDTLTERCIRGIEAQEEACAQHLENSMAMATMLCPHMGYTEAAEIAKSALHHDRTLREELMLRGKTAQEAAEMLDCRQTVDVPLKNPPHRIA